MTHFGRKRSLGLRALFKKYFQQENVLPWKKWFFCNLVEKNHFFQNKTPYNRTIMDTDNDLENALNAQSLDNPNYWNEDIWKELTNLLYKKRNKNPLTTLQ